MMKFTSVYASLLLAGLSAIGLADISFDPLPLRLYAGDSCELHWTSDRDYNLELLLVQRFDEDGMSGWSPVRTIFKDRHMAAGSESYIWTVPNVEEHDFSYSLWLSGNESRSSGYANLTNRFHIESTEEGGRRLISLGQIAGIFVGFLACLLMFAAATTVLLRLMRQTACVKDNGMEDTPYDSPDFDSVMDEKAGLRLAMEADQIVKYERRL